MTRRETPPSTALQPNSLASSALTSATPIEGAKVVRAAQEAGFRKSETIHGIRVEGTDRAGLGGRIARALAEAGLSCRGLQASVIGRNFLSFLALDTAEDAAKAVKVLRKL